MRCQPPIETRKSEPCLSRHRSQTEFCIDAFVTETGYVPADARAVRASHELSPQLERSVQRLPPTAAWCAWADGARGWFVEGRLAGGSPESTDRPTLYLMFRDPDAVPVVAGMWRRSAPARWDLLRVFAHDAG